MWPWGCFETLSRLTNFREKARRRAILLSGAGPEGGREASWPRLRKEMRGSVAQVKRWPDRPGRGPRGDTVASLHTGCAACPREAQRSRLGRHEAEAWRDSPRQRRSCTVQGHVTSTQVATSVPTARMTSSSMRREGPQLSRPPRPSLN